MLSKALLFIAASIGFIGCAHSREQDYSLVCDKEADRSKSEVVTKPIHAPLNFRIRFTGKNSKQKEQDGTLTPYHNLVLSIGDKRMSGGAVQGSTYDSSMIFDERFLATGQSNTEWAWSRGIDAWTLHFNNRDYICQKR